jgi:hypothetical protein
MQRCQMCSVSLPCLPPKASHTVTQEPAGGSEGQAQLHTLQLEHFVDALTARGPDCQQSTSVTPLQHDNSCSMMPCL